jgi:aminopeptidase N
MENASAIFYSEEAVADGRDSEELLAHEIAHQWYGNTVTEADWPHLWLSEGFATYLTGLWLEETYGEDRLRQYMRRARDRVRTFARQRPDEPLVDTTYASPMELLNPNAYQKGAWVLHMLRQEVGTETFWTALRQYYDRYRHANASTADFRAVVEDVSGRDLEAFFEQWTRRAGHPVLQIDWSYRAETEACVVEVRQVQEAPPFRIPLDVQVGGADAEIRTVDLRGRQSTSELPCPTPPAQLRVDPRVRLLGEWTVEPRRD